MRSYLSTILLCTINLVVANQFARPKESEVTTSIWLPSITSMPTPFPVFLKTTPSDAPQVSTYLGISFKGIAAPPGDQKVEPLWHNAGLNYVGSVLTWSANGWDESTKTINLTSFEGSAFKASMTATCTSTSGAQYAICSGNRTSEYSLWESTAGGYTSVKHHSTTVIPVPSSLWIATPTVTVTDGNVWPKETSKNAAPPRATGEVLMGAAAALAGGVALFL